MVPLEEERLCVFKTKKMDAWTTAAVCALRCAEEVTASLDKSEGKKRAKRASGSGKKAAVAVAALAIVAR